MIRSNPIRSLSALLVALVISSCSDSAFRSPTAPIEQFSAPAADGSVKSGPTDALTDPAKLKLRALWWKKSHKDVIRVSKMIDASGGTITMSTGLTIVFPKGALSAPLTITVTSDDEYVAYKMEPAGTKFLEDVTVTQLLDVVQIARSALRSQLYAAYIADDKAKLTGKIPVLEIEPSSTILSPKTGLPQAQVWTIRHFSRYMLASG